MTCLLKGATQPCQISRIDSNKNYFFFINHLIPNFYYEEIIYISGCCYDALLGIGRNSYCL